MLAAFFLPYILPVTVVYLIWDWMLEPASSASRSTSSSHLVGKRVNVWRTMPLVHADGRRCVTIWWTNGFSILLFLAGLRNISARDLRGRRARRRHALADVPAHHLAADLAGDRALPHHPADPAAQDLRPGLSVRATAAARRRPWCWCSTSSEQAFQKNQGGYGATVAVALFVIVVVFSVLQFQVLRVRGGER